MKNIRDDCATDKRDRTTHRYEHKQETSFVFQIISNGACTTPQSKLNPVDKTLSVRVELKRWEFYLFSQMLHTTIGNLIGTYEKGKHAFPKLYQKKKKNTYV